MIKKNIVDTVDDEVLRIYAGTDTAVFSGLENEIFQICAPYSYGGQPLSEITPYEHVFFEIMQSVFDIVVRLDNSVQHGDELKELAKEKSQEINPILDAIGIERITLTDGYLDALFQIKMKGLEVLKTLTGDIKDEHYKLETRGVLPQDQGSFTEIKEMITELFGGDVPILGYGSKFNGSKAPNDIDTRVYIDNLTLETYRMIERMNYYVNELPLEFVLIPNDYSLAFDLSDNTNTSSPRNSRMLNGKIRYVEFSDSYFFSLRLHNIVKQCIRLRNSLTNEGLERSENLLRRINSYVKSPRFICEDLNYVTGSQLETKQETLFELLPRWDMLIISLIDANMYTHRLINESSLRDYV